MRRFFDPVSLKVLDLVPLPTNDALVNNFQGPISPARNITDEVTARIDYHISSQGHVLRPVHLQFQPRFRGRPVSALRTRQQRPQLPA